MVAFKNSTGIKANSSFCTFRFPTAEARQLAKPFQYQPITTTLPTQPIAHFVFMPIKRRIFVSKSNKHNNGTIYIPFFTLCRTAVDVILRLLFFVCKDS
jgi:hypothetical protein